MESGKQEPQMIKEEMDTYNNNNNTEEIKSDPAQETRESRRRDYMHRPYEFEVEPHVKLSDKVMIPIKKYPKVPKFIFKCFFFEGDVFGRGVIIVYLFAYLFKGLCEYFIKYLCIYIFQFNFVGKLLGPKGYTFKRLQNLTGCKMSILGRGSMRDREKV